MELNSIHNLGVLLIYISLTLIIFIYHIQKEKCIYKKKIYLRTNIMVFTSVILYSLITNHNITVFITSLILYLMSMNDLDDLNITKKTK